MSKTLLKNCVEILDSQRIPLSSAEREKLEKVYPYYGAQGIIDYVDHFIFDGEYILVAEDGNNLKSLAENIATWATGQFWVNNHAHILGEKSGYCLRYIYYILNTLDLRGYITGSAQPKFNQENLARVELDLPDYKTQCAIAETLTSLDSKISNNMAICSELESMAKLLYDYWFVQFDFPDENGKPYKSSGGKMVWNEELKREIPEGWTVSKLGNECEILLGGTPDTTKTEYWDGDIPWLNSGEVACSPVLFAEKRITEDGMNNSATAFAEAGAVVMSITRYIRPSILGINACFNQSVVAVKPTHRFHTSYIYPLMKSNVDRYMKLRTGAQQPHINKETVEETLFLCPSEHILRKYYPIVESLYEQQMNISKESIELTSLRDFLLPMLMNGQVSFKDN